MKKPPDYGLGGFFIYIYKGFLYNCSFILTIYACHQSSKRYCPIGNVVQPSCVCPACIPCATGRTGHGKSHEIYGRQCEYPGRVCVVLLARPVAAMGRNGSL